MASGTAGSSAVNMLRQLLGRIGDLSAATDQRGSSSRRRTAPQTTASVENEVCSLFGAGHQARSAMHGRHVFNALFNCQRVLPFG